MQLIKGGELRAVLEETASMTAREAVDMLIERAMFRQPAVAVGSGTIQASGEPARRSPGEGRT